MIPWRDEQPSRRFPAVTVLLIAVNAAIFVWSRFFSGHYEQVLTRWGYTSSQWAANLLAPSPDLAVLATPFTSIFLHDGVLHTLGNAWFLGVFGDNVEEGQGRWRFLFFYLVCGLFSVFAYHAMEPANRLPLVGASGAISGVLAAYALYYPKAVIRSFVPVIVILVPMRVPALVFIAGWMVIQLAGTMMSTGEPGVAYAAHLGGFVAGLALAPVFRKRKRRR